MAEATAKRGGMGRGRLAAALTVASGVYAFVNKPEFRRALVVVSTSTRQWARNVKQARDARRLQPDRENGVRGVIRDRYGAGGLLHRLDDLASAIADIEGLVGEGSIDLSAKERDLRRRITATARLSSGLRRPKLRALSAEVDELEDELADAIG